MSWRAVVAAVDEHEAIRSRVSLYLHPLAGRPILWHVLRALVQTSPAPTEIVVLHRPGGVVPIDVEADADVVYRETAGGDVARALRAAVTPPGLTVLVDGAAALVTPATLARLIRAGDHGLAALFADGAALDALAVAGEGPAIASAVDPRAPLGAARVAPADATELLRVADRHSLGAAGVVVRDRLVRQHERNGVSFVLPATTWLDVDVRIGADTVVYPGCVLEGTTEIGGESVIGPHSRVIDSAIGRGVELRGWNYLCRTHVRNRAVIEPFSRRGGE